jgi:hypothetical protein
MVGAIVRLFVQFLRSCSISLWWDMQNRLAGRHLEWRLGDVVIFCWRDFTMMVLLCWRASQYDRRMRRFRRVKGVK